MGSLLAGVAHELNNPLSVVTGQALLLRRATTDPGLRDRAEKISRAAERCARIVRTFLALARQRPPERGCVVVNDVVHEAVELLAYPLRVDNVRVSLDLADGLPVLWADPNQLHQVLVNLLTNAHQAIRSVAEPRHVTLSTRLDAARARLLLTVADNGPGVPAEIQSRVFDAFFTTKPPGQGTGLGLSLCQGIVASHNGTIGLQSRPGVGTIFTVDLPIESPPDSVAPPDGATSAQRPAGRRILVIDDEPEILEILVEMLGTGDVTVDTARDGVRALEKLFKHHYDAVLTDVRMPGLDGPALYRAAGHHDPALPARFIFITGDTLRPETRAFLEGTGAPVVHKPFERRRGRPRTIANLHPLGRLDSRQHSQPGGLTAGPHANQSGPVTRGAPRLRRGATSLGGLGAISGPPSKSIRPPCCPRAVFSRSATASPGCDERRGAWGARD